MPKMKLFDYDTRNDSLYMKKYGKVKGSSEVEGFEDIIIDFSTTNVPIGLEVLNASKVLNLSRSFLSKLEGAAFGIEGREGRMFIVMLLKAGKGVQERVTIPVSVKS